MEQQGEIVQSTALARVVPGGLEMPTGTDLRAYQDAATWIGRGRMFLQYQNPEQVFTAMLFVRDMGISMTMGLREGFVIHGKFDTSVKAKLASLMARVPTFEYVPDPWNAETVTVNACLNPHAPGAVWRKFTYTRAEADASGYTKGDGDKVKDNWQREPKFMLLWRCLTRWFNLYASHILLGAPTVIQQDVPELAEPEEPIEGRAVIVGDGEDGEGAGVGSGVKAGTQTGQPSSVEQRTAPSPGLPAEERRVVHLGVEPDEKPTRTDPKKMALAIMRANGYIQPGKQMELVNTIQAEAGLQLVRSARDLATQDWERIYEWLMVRINEKNWLAPKTAGNGEPNAGSPPAQPAPAPPAALTLEQLVKDRGAMVSWLQSAQAKLKLPAETPLVTENPEGSGDWYFMLGEILRDCGEQEAAMLTTKNPEWESYLASDPLVAMIGKAVEQRLEKAAGPRRPGLTARQQAAVGAP
jgi:hypothetical protein